MPNITTKHAAPSVIDALPERLRDIVAISLPTTHERDTAASSKGTGTHRLDAIRYATHQDVRDAQKALQHIQAATAPPTPAEHLKLTQRLFDYLEAATTNPPTNDKAREMRQMALIAATKDMPKAAWNAHAHAQMMKKFHFWPSVAEISQIIDAEAQKIRHAEMQIQRLAAIKLPSPPARKKPTEKEKKAVAEMVRNMKKDPQSNERNT